MELSVGSLFAGIGGIDLAFTQAGCKIAWAIEKDAACCRTYRHNFKETVLIEKDIRLDNVASFFKKHGKEEQINDIQEMLKITTDANASALIQSLIDSIKIEEVVECLKFLHPDRNNISEEQQGIVNYLTKLQTDGIIEKYVRIVNGQ